MADGAPQLVEQPLRQAQVNAGDEHLGAQRFQLADPLDQLLLIQIFAHKF